MNTKTMTTNTEYNKSIKEMLLEGATEDELLNILKSQINAAQTEIDEDNKAKAKEAEKAETVAATRKAATIAIINYLNALNLVPDELTEEELNEIYEELEKEMEKYEKTFLRWNGFIINMLADAESSKEEKKKEEKYPLKGFSNIKVSVDEDADDIIKNFIRDLI